MKSKRAELMQQILVQIIVVVLVVAIFLFATAEKINGRGVKQQVLEKELALLIDSGIPGMSFTVLKRDWRTDGFVGDVKLKDGRVYVKVNGLSSLRGYPYFSRYSVHVEEREDSFVISIK